MDPLPSYGIMPHGAFASVPAVSDHTNTTDLTHTCARLSLNSLQTLGILVLTSILLGRTFGRNSALQILTLVSEARLNLCIWIFGAAYDWHHRSTPPNCDWCGLAKFALIVGLGWYQFWDDLGQARLRRASIMEEEMAEFVSKAKVRKRSSLEHVKALVAIYHGLNIDR